MRMEKTPWLPKTDNAHTGIHQEHQKDAVLTEKPAMQANSNNSPGWIEDDEQKAQAEVMY